MHLSRPVVCHHSCRGLVSCCQCPEGQVIFSVFLQEPDRKWLKHQTEYISLESCSSNIWYQSDFKPQKSPDIVLSPGFMLLAPWLALQGALSCECTVRFHPGGGTPGTGQQRQRTRRQGLRTLQERDLEHKGGKMRHGRQRPCQRARKKTDTFMLMSSGARVKLCRS